MNQEANQNQDDEEPPLIVSELYEFVPLLEDWHERQVKLVQHLMQIPPGQEVEIEGETPFVLEGETLKGYQLGISLALCYLGSLPFSSDRDSEPPMVH